MDQSIAEQARTVLSEYDFQAWFDISGSMDRPVKAGSTRSRWKAAQETAQQFADKISAIDSDGIAVGFFGGSTIQAVDGVTGDKVAELFGTKRPSGSTPLHLALAEAFKLAGKSGKKDFIVVFTDGEPDEPALVAEAIKKQANSQTNDDDCTLLFVQIGDDAGATRYLQSLDDNLKGAKFDIVDVKTQDQAEQYSSIEELLLAAIND